MAKTYETTPQAVIEFYKLGKNDGFEEGAAEMQQRLVKRAERFIEQRLRERRAEGKPEETDRFDTCTLVLRELVEWLSATVADVTPEGVSRG